jgi:hypothetical protein
VDQPDGARLRSAFELVQADVDATLGTGIVAVAIPSESDPVGADELAADDSELLDLLTRPRFGTVSDAWIYLPGESGATGIDDSGGMFVDLVVRVAEATQERVMESRRFFGAAFPECPEHPNTPLWPKARGADAVWACIDGGSTAIRIGGLGEGAAGLTVEPRTR